MWLYKLQASAASCAPPKTLCRPQFGNHCSIVYKWFDNYPYLLSTHIIAFLNVKILTIISMLKTAIGPKQFIFHLLQMLQVMPTISFIVQKCWMLRAPIKFLIGVWLWYYSILYKKSSLPLLYVKRLEWSLIIYF